MSDYEPKSYYDIQLTKKQIGVLFIAGIAILTLVFFLGLMLGKSYMEAKYAQQKPMQNKIYPYEPKEPIKSPESEINEPKQQYEFYKLKDSSEQQRPESTTTISPSEEKPEKEQKQIQPAESAGKPSPAATEFFTLQIHAFKDEKSANSKKEFYMKKGYSVNVIFIDNLYKVRIGKFKTKDEALAFKKKFEQQEKVPAFIVKF